MWLYGEGSEVLFPFLLSPQSVLYMFGVLGIPVTEIALAIQELGIRDIEE